MYLPNLKTTTVASASIAGGFFEIGIQLLAGFVIFIAILGLVRALWYNMRTPNPMWS